MVALDRESLNTGGRSGSLDYIYLKNDCYNISRDRDNNRLYPENG